MKKRLLLLSVGMFLSGSAFFGARAASDLDLTILDTVNTEKYIAINKPQEVKGYTLVRNRQTRTIAMLPDGNSSEVLFSFIKAQEAVPGEIKYIEKRAVTPMPVKLSLAGRDLIDCSSSNMGVFGNFCRAFRDYLTVDEKNPLGYGDYSTLSNVLEAMNQGVQGDKLKVHKFLKPELLSTAERSETSVHSCAREMFKFALAREIKKTLDKNEMQCLVTNLYLDSVAKYLTENNTTSN